MTEEGYFEGLHKVTASCAPTDFTLVYLLLAYIIAVLLLATAMGFKTRKLPENYKVFIGSLINNFFYLMFRQINETEQNYTN